MSVYHRSTAKSRILQEYRDREEEIATALSRQMSHKNGVESEKRLRRAIANSNERRRMQSINAGFQLLRTLLPHSEGEKMSKAAILQQTTEFIQNLQQDNAKLSAQNSTYKRILGEVSRRCNIDFELDISLYGGSPPLKRKKRDTESSDEGITADYEDFKHEDIRREVNLLRQQLDQERQLRMILELRARRLDSHALPDPSLHVVSAPVEPTVHAVKPPLPPPPTPPVQEKAMEEIRQDEVPQFKALKLDVEPDHRVPCSPQHKSETPSSTSTSASAAHFRSGLEFLSEAIRHVESKDVDMPVSPAMSIHHRVPAVPTATDLSRSSSSSHMLYSEDSDHVCVNSSDQDDVHSESSGRDSPSGHTYVRLHSAHNLKVPAASQALLASPKLHSSSSNYSEKYPAVANVLQGNSPQGQHYYRPGVIVQKS